MTDRAEDISAFLASTCWATWQQEQLAGDASSRRYLRLRQGSETAILMDADPARDQQTQPFLTIAEWLRHLKLASPAVLKADTKKGFLLLEDLGPHHLADHIALHPDDTMRVYAAATEVLIALHQAAPPADLPRMTPAVGGAMLDITMAWYANAADQQSLPHAMETHLRTLCGPPNHVALRDYHAENLIWRPHLTGHARIGLLDFQDAFVAPRGYDLVSLLRDVRRTVDPALCAAMQQHFCAETGPLPDGAFACLAVQRNLRILGVFARLARRDGKRRYMAMIPHVWRMIMNDLAHPALRELAKVATATLPPPDSSAIKDLL